MTSWPKLLLTGSALAFCTAARSEVPFYQARVAPILDRHCVVCHGPEKQKAKLRMDTLEGLLKGAEAGPVVKADSPKESELFRRITLPKDHDEVMPSDGKPLLSADEIRTLELWIAGGASATKVLADFPGAPALAQPKAPPIPLAADWRPRAAEIAALEKELGVRLVARSQVPTDGLVLRTASAPSRCDDAAIARLAPVAGLIVEAELARTAVTDAGVAMLAGWDNLRHVDLTRTAVTSRGAVTLSGSRQIEALNLTDTAVDDRAVEALLRAPSLQRLWLFGTKVTSVATSAEAGQK